MNSDPKVPVDKKWINISRKRAVGMSIIDALAKFLRVPDADADILFSEDMNKHSILGNILVMQSMIEYLVVDLHLYRFATSVIAKDFMVNYDVLCKDHTGLILKGTPTLTKKDPSSKKDHHLHTKLRNALSQTTDYQERIKNCAEILRTMYPDVTTKEEKERFLSEQMPALKKAARKIGLDERCRIDIQKELNLIVEKKIKDYGKQEQVQQKQSYDCFASMLGNS